MTQTRSSKLGTKTFLPAGPAKIRSFVSDMFLYFVNAHMLYSYKEKECLEIDAVGRV
jgi:hypothetical protein